MDTDRHLFKPIVAAVVVAVGISLPAGLAAQVDAAQIDDLFDQLQQADERQAVRIERQIYDAWSKSGSPAMDLLLKRGRDALGEGDPEAALDHFSALVDHAPDFAEAYNGRATAYYLLGFYGPALDDIREALVLNPRHFGAMQGFGVMLEEMGREAEALEVLRRVRALHPQAPQIAEVVERLETKLSGRTL
jgi:tetratricopeptide (TPR) repeat protein